jgi:hypothetical protein
VKEKADPGKQGYKKDSNQSNIHTCPLPLERRRINSSMVTSGEYADCRVKSSRAKWVAEKIGNNQEKKDWGAGWRASRYRPFSKEIG